MILVNIIMECLVFEYPDCEKNPQNAWQVHLTQMGFQKYIDANAKLSLNFVNSLVLPDFSINVNGAKFKFFDMHVTQFNIPQIRITYLENNQVIARFEKLALKLSLQFNFSQTTYPYLSDSGPGFIKIDDITMSLQANPMMNETRCKTHYFINISDAFTSVNLLQVKLDGKLGFLYDSLLNVIANLIKKNFNSELGRQLIMGISEVANQGLEGDAHTCTCIEEPLYSDQRSLGVFITPYFLVAKSVGVMMYSKVDPFKDHKAKFYGYTNEIKVNPFETYYTNDDIHYHVHSITFQSLFNNIHKYVFNKTNEIVINSPPQAIKFVNRGLLVNYSINNFTTQFLLDIQMPFRSVNDIVNMTMIRPIITNQIFCSGTSQQCSSEDLSGLIKKLNDLYQIYAPEYANANALDKCTTIFHEQDWMLGACNVLNIV